MKKSYLGVIILFFLIGIFVWQAFYLPKDLNIKESKLFLVQRKQRLFQISENLEEQGLIKDKFLFDFYVILKRGEKKLQAGEYYLSPSMSTATIAKKIISGDTAKEILTIPEGWNLRDIGWYFENKGMFMAEELFELAGFPLIDYFQIKDLPTRKDFSDEFDFLKDKSNNVSLEGYLFPDTYYVERAEELESIVRKMLDNFDKKLIADFREEIQNQNKTIFEIIIMASLLEKEVKTLEEKEIVSGILWKRRYFEFPLQVDATIIYITGKKTIKVSKEETQIDSPYNTYKYFGLPLGPICNPGIDSILAAIYPEDSQYWYYLSPPEGETIFSQTLEEHNIAKAQYLK